MSWLQRGVGTFWSDTSACVLVVVVWSLTLGVKPPSFSVPKMGEFTGGQLGTPQRQ